ncbi:hypothetical protein PRK78_004517 [Emydomyces testavorans]|uniref:Uncharacterized protein n=1 Tax=Emydomyces testavorans TaxID=2070801 RepID=A0AAF0DHX3_9EURO|nr:hypothetical protein PRK78_004517 [Emydomyces testavorans]
MKQSKLADSTSGMHCALHHGGAVPQRCANESERAAAKHEFLHCLPHGTREYTYQGKAAMARAIRDEGIQFMEDKTGSKSQFIVFSSVPQALLQQDSDLRFVDYHIYLQILVIKMPAASHEEASARLNLCLVSRLLQWGIQNDLHLLGATTVHGSQRDKCPDRSYRPVNLPPNRSTHWPTLVVETGYSESGPKLSEDAAWWLNESNGDVQIVITIKIERKSRKLILDRWERVARLTRRNPVRNAIVQRVTVYPTQERPARVVGGPLILPFSKIFLRNPVGQEGDFTFSDNELIENLANSVWSVM